LPPNPGTDAKLNRDDAPARSQASDCIERDEINVRPWVVRRREDAQTEGDEGANGIAEEETHAPCPAEDTAASVPCEMATTVLSAQSETSILHSSRNS
jgi:hypothetical protein